MIIIPMAGLSSRFFKAGYSEPKYKLSAHGKTLFNWSLSSFKQYFDSELFIIICRDVYDTPAFVASQLDQMGVKHYQIKTLEAETRGQAETVALALDLVPDNEPLLIFNIDTCRHQCTYPDAPYDAWLEVFEGEGDHWSFAKIDANTDLVTETTEKVRISNLCSNGVYYFKDKVTYNLAYQQLKRDTQTELYIAPMFNYIIGSGGKVGYRLVPISSHIFMGTPAEYEQFLRYENV
ncbi:hypothetical protein SAMN05880558_102123 [Aeromonas sp. RU39B]|uniref:glycosyltransferase family 2 protein n=1 Tax=Aeromonas sp. RU39B TaxID=1907416 RepID=UPI000957029A|nr:glycosyltransferase family 2 protein [Aeromonas sp. RU39B]SIQ13844.1 hypothetical protein SAMN05880558_102123 [Aeromonas sp. RU39B]